MAERVLQHTTVIPAGTTQAAPHIEQLGFHDWDVERIDLTVPPGPAGAMGFYLANNGMPWVPRSAGEWLVWDDRQMTVDPTGYPTGTGWQIYGYNQGAYDHVVIALFHVNPVVSQAETAAVPLVLTFVERDVADRLVVVL